MDKFSDYIILHASTTAELTGQVRQYLEKDWLLLGAPFSFYGGEATEICQAMIKKEAPGFGAIGFNRTT